MTWPPPSIDPLIRRTPPPGTRAERPAPERPQPGPRPATHRKPVARFGRISSVALSMAATGGLTWSFAQADHDSEADARVEPTASSPTAGTPGATASPSTEATATVVVSATGASSSTTTTVSATTTTHAPTTTTTTSTAAITTAITGTFTGEAVPTRFGPVQVAVTYTNGVITDVTATEYPSGNRKDRAINARALPVLRQEVLTAQSASVHSVSGATYTSHAYIASLQAAIDAATAGG